MSIVSFHPAQFYAAGDADGATDPPDDVVRHMQTEGQSPAAKSSATATLGFALLDANPDLILLIDQAGGVLWTNRAARAELACPDGRVGGARYVTDYWPALTASALAGVVAVSDTKECPQLMASTHRAGDSRWWNVRIAPVAPPDGGLGRQMLIAQDVSVQVQASAAAERAIGYDRLTGLPGGELFRNHVDALIAAGDHSFTVLAVDLDPPRLHHDSRGPQGGDDAMCRVAAGLARTLRKGEMAARIDGGWFGVVLRDRQGEGPQHVVLRARALISRLARPVATRSREAGMAISIGLARCLAGSVNAEIMCRNAQYALLEARKIGRGEVAEFDAAMNDALAARDEMLALAECALATRSIYPHYQPQVDLLTGQITGFEALLRWRSATGAIESPASICCAFENPGLSARITETMFSRVITDLKRWQRRGMALTIAINVTGSDLRQPGFAERLIDRLAAAGLPPSCIEIEITETVMLSRNADDLVPLLRRLRAAGIKIALDDFGTGYATLLHLRHLPVDVIKIDRSFVSSLGECPEDCAIVETMLSLAGRLGMRVVGEGVETAGHARFLRERGCQTGQGYFFGKAVPAHDVPRMLAKPMPEFTAGPDIACSGCAGRQA